MSHRWVRRASAPAAAAFCLLLAACAQGTTRSAAGDPEASIDIMEPGDGASVDSPVELVVSVQGVEIGPPETGLMHLHAYVDDSNEYAVMTSTRFEVPVPAGEHTVRVVLAGPNHDETRATDSVSLTVMGGAQPPPSPADQGGYGGGYG